MARYENQLFKRTQSIADGTDIYTTPGGIKYDLSAMRFLTAGIDTIRQIYTCKLKCDVISSIIDHIDNEDDPVKTIGGVEWLCKKSGKNSGYQLILKNLDFGFVILLKHFYTEGDQRGPHIKVEATPEVIHRLGLTKLTHVMRAVCSNFADTLEASGIALHLACDMKGLQLPDDFESKMHTRAKRQFKAHGISNIHYDVSETAFVYGRGETYMFGNANSLQMCLYNKTTEALKTGKLNYWESRWKTVPSLEDLFTAEYRDGSDGGEADIVHRLEFRLHHTIIRQFEQGNFEETGNLICIREPRDLKPHIQALWDYCLNNFRLQHSSQYIHPIWQKIQADVRFAFLESHEEFVYKRGYNSPGKKLDGTLRRNVAMWLSNVCKLAANNGLTPDHVTKWIMSSGLDIELAEYFEIFLYGNTQLLWQLVQEHIERKMRDYRLAGIAA